MTCPRCTKYLQSNELLEILETQLDLKNRNLEGLIYRLDCKLCNQFIAIKVNDDILDVNNPCNEKYDNCWREVTA